MYMPKLKLIHLFYFFVLLFCVIGGILIHYTTYQTPWVVSDTAGYFEAAENLIAGKGFVLIKASGVSESLRFHTPFYSLVLSPGVLLGVELIQYTRWLNIFSFIVLIFILGFMGYRLSKMWAFPLVLILYVVSSPAFIFSYSGAMSEPLFFLLSIASIFFLQAFFMSNSKKQFIIACILTSAVFLTRYIGIAIVLSGGLALLIFSQGRFIEKFKTSALYLTISSFPFLLFIVSILARGDTPGIYQSFDRSLWHELNPVRVEIIEELWTGFRLDNILPWVQYRLKLVFVIFCFLLLVALIIHSVWSQKRTQKFVIYKDFFFRSGVIFALIAIFSLMVIGITYVIVRVPKPSLDQRVLLPIIYSSIFSVISFVFYLSTQYRKSKFIIYLFLVILSCNLIAGNISLSQELINDLHQHGFGYSTPGWRDSDVLDAVKSLPDDVPIITNDTIAIQYYTGRRSYQIHEMKDKSLLNPPYKYGDNMEDNYNNIFRNDGAALVLFNSIKWQLWSIYGEQTPQILDVLTTGLDVYYDGRDGNIYFYNEFDLE